MNIFNKILEDEYAGDTRLGNPSRIMPLTAGA
jgi:hypothetical protein